MRMGTQAWVNTWTLFQASPPQSGDRNLNPNCVESSAAVQRAETLPSRHLLAHPSIFGWPCRAEVQHLTCARTALPPIQGAGLVLSPLHLTESQLGASLHALTFPTL